MLPDYPVGARVWIRYKPFAIISHFTAAEVVRHTKAAIHVKLPNGRVERYSKKTGERLPDKLGWIVPEEPIEGRCLRPTDAWRRKRDAGNE